MKNRKLTGDLLDNEVAALQLADDLVSCRLPPPDSEEQQLRKIVSEVQKHDHTKSCLKYNGSCRYGFPKLPSPRTLIAKPLEQTIPEVSWFGHYIREWKDFPVLLEA